MKQVSAKEFTSFTSNLPNKNKLHVKSAFANGIMTVRFMNQQAETVAKYVQEGDKFTFYNKE